MKSLRKDERGISQVIIIVLVLVVLGAAGFIGWRVSQNNKDNSKPTATTSSSKAADSDCMKVYDDKNLCKAAGTAADFSKLSYTATDTGTDAQGQASHLTLKSDGKGDTEFTTTTGGQAFSTVMIGNTIYTRTGSSGPWTKYTSNSSATTNPTGDLKTQFSTSATAASARIKYKSLGTEKCGSDTCYKYQVTDPTTPGNTNYVWFNTKDYKLQRFYAKTAQGSNDFVITYQPVTITAPSPVVSTHAPTY